MRQFKDLLFNINKYYIEYYKRDVLFLFFITLIFVTTYIVVFFASDYKTGLSIRLISLSEWIALVALYTLSTSFNNYFCLRRAYSSVLLPVSQNNKYFWEWFRTLILFGGISFGLLYVVDYYMVDKLYYDKYLADFDSVKSLMGTLLDVKEPLNYIPSLLYSLVLLHSFVMCGVMLFNKRILVVILALMIVLIDVFLEFYLLKSYYSITSYPFISIKCFWGNLLSYNISWFNKSSEYILSYFYLFLLPISFILLSYYIFREKQIK